MRRTKEISEECRGIFLKILDNGNEIFVTFPEIFSILMKLGIFQIPQKLPKIFHVFSNGMINSGRLEMISENLRSVWEMRRNYEKYGREKFEK